MAYLKNWTDNFFQMFFMGTSWVAISIKNIKTRASREMTSRKNIKMVDFNGVNIAKPWHVSGARYLPSLIALFVLVITDKTFTDPNYVQMYTDFLECHDDK